MRMTYLILIVQFLYCIFIAEYLDASSQPPKGKPKKAIMSFAALCICQSGQYHHKRGGNDLNCMDSHFFTNIVKQNGIQ